jgi:hypothetical protein
LIYSLVPRGYLPDLDFKPSRQFALSALETCARWKSKDRSEIYSSIKKSNLEKVPFKLLSGGMRSFLGDIALFTYHILLPFQFEILDIDIPLASSTLDSRITGFPNSFLFSVLQAKLLILKGDSTGASEKMSKAIKKNRKIPSTLLNAISELALCNASQCQWEQAIETLNLIIDESKPDYIVNMYMKAVFLLQLDSQGNEKTILDIMNLLISIEKNEKSKSPIQV